jgi:2C-methyl-D-erythritol 2,4-cyclodiphosphate synthase
MYQEIKAEQKKHYEITLAKIEKFFEKCDKFYRITDTEFPRIEEMVTQANEEGQRVNEAMAVLIIKKYKQNWIRELFKAIKKNREV